MLDFFRNYPLSFYLRTFFGLPAPVDTVFLLKGSEKVSLLSRRNQRSDSLFQPEVQKKIGAPVLLSQSAGASTFNPIVFPKANSRNRFILDCPDTTVTLIQTSSLGVTNVAELQSTPLSTLLPTFDSNNAMRWEFLTPDLAPLADPLPDSFFLVGIPTHYCRWIEQWTEAAGGAVVTIVPMLLATLNLCRDKGPLVLVPGTTNSNLCVIEEGRYRLISRQPAFTGIKPDHLQAVLADLSETLNLPESNLNIVPVSDVPISRLREFTAAFDTSPRILQATPQHPIHVEGNSPLSIEACIMEGLFQ